MSVVDFTERPDVLRLTNCLALNGDLIEYATIREMRFLCPLPATKHFINRHQFRRRELLRELRSDFEIARAIAMFRGDCLTFGGVNKFKIHLSDFARAAFIDNLVNHAHRRLGEDRQRWRDQLKSVRTELLDRKIGFVFPCDEHVANAALNKGGGRAARARVKHFYVVKNRFG